MGLREIESKDESIFCSEKSDIEVYLARACCIDNVVNCSCNAEGELKRVLSGHTSYVDEHYSGAAKRRHCYWLRRQDCVLLVETTYTWPEDVMRCTGHSKSEECAATASHTT